MAIFPTVFLPLLLLTYVIHCATADSDDLVTELLSLQSRSKSGIIHLDDQLISRFLTSTKPPRPYSLLIFFDAEQLHSKPELHLQDLYTQYSLVSSSFIANNDVSAASSLFFCDIEFKESQKSFSLFGVNSLPHIRLVGPNVKNLQDLQDLYTQYSLVSSSFIANNDVSAASSLFFCDIEFKESQKSFSLFGVNSLPHIRLVGPNVKNLQDSEVMEQGDFSRMAESMSEFVESRTKLNVGPIHRPPIVSKNQIAFLVVTVLIWVRKMPLFLVDRNDPSKLVFFHQGSGMQLGGEGFAVGFLYTTVGLLLGVVTHVLVRVNNRSAQQVVMGVALVVSFWAVKKVVSLDNWKTGYGVHAFWPTSWR
ncbi:hypothetical protein DKX38_005407 [Salix brachista]|uniref:Dolichyl-diphosphooligosaccharide--protein glycosyltransferase subunit 3 n=1 Tax=Salix brachista TaxID=2182728 RepID=A0A5N5MZF3_9ROSI|nr:hypothetical protein DKX38_005407 [Salix brachista]